MLKINDKTFLNIQEAVQWLMDNNALPFQCTANYAANTEIGLGTIVNPTMAKVRIGSLIFFADSKVSTVIGVTSNGFIVSDQYNDLVDDVVYVSNVQINASGHLIVTLSNGTQIDAGLIKQVASFSIDGSQHLIATYNDGSTNDLGAIFNGNISISGNISATGIVSATEFQGATSLATIKDANGNLRFVEGNIGYITDHGFNVTYAKWALSGNHLMFVVSVKIDPDFSMPGSVFNFSSNSLPQWIADKIVPSIGNYVDFKEFATTDNGYLKTRTIQSFLSKASATEFRIYLIPWTLGANAEYVRFEYDLIID